MYEKRWGLTDSPFRNTIDDRWFYESPVHEEALARLFFLVEEQRRCGLLTGAAGTGKTLLLKILQKQSLRTQRDIATIDLTGLRGDEIYFQLAESLKFSAADSASPYTIRRMLREHLQYSYRSEAQTVLILDHFDFAEGESARVVEQLLRLDSGSDCSMTVIVALRSRSDYGSAGDLVRLSDLCIDLPALDREQTALFVKEVLRHAGCNRPIFNEAALEALFAHTGGIPRAINRLCDLSLLAAMSENKSAIDENVVNMAADEIPAMSGNSTGAKIIA